MHAIIAYGVNSEVRNYGPTGPAMNSIGCLCYNYPCKGQQLFYLDHDRVEASKGVGVQGHPGQFLAIVARVAFVRRVTRCWSAASNSPWPT